jgi:hypothetical protein
VYAIKEFKAGPLRNHVWFYNKLVVSKCWAEAVQAINAISRTPNRNKLSTALEAISEFESSLGNSLPKHLATKYPNTTLGEINARKDWLG